MDCNWLEGGEYCTAASVGKALDFDGPVGEGRAGHAFDNALTNRTFLPKHGPASKVPVGVAGHVEGVVLPCNRADIYAKNTVLW